ncbi:extracellular mutant protein 11 domain-containing protein [Purpureocillium lavendulum]|uniref:Extracellular mutant protein 11 domain-containing protein n=1 Tax=Purpureocillium lavendulum TaxID=1247861 RepID=A0AB34FYB3_9HYPO|nr:extracellular mutant protein 11 domain-containing protein [Purpureocillium lavendulum]
MGYKEKGGKLAAFVRGSNSDGDVGLKPGLPLQEPVEAERPGTPQNRLPAQARQQLAEAIKMPVPLRPRSAVPSQREPKQEPLSSQARLQSPRRNVQSVPVFRPGPPDVESNHKDIFSGSQLGDDFMQSGLTTPQNEPEDLEGEVTPTAKRRNVDTMEAQFGDLIRRSHQAPRSQSFAMNENGRVSVIDGNRRRLPRQMMDGFHDDDEAFEAKARQLKHTFHQRPSVAPQHQTGVRQIRLSKPSAVAPLLTAIEEPEEAQSPTSSAESARWQGHRDKDRDSQRQRPYDPDWDVDMGVESTYGDPHPAAEPKVTVEMARRPAATTLMQPNMAQHRHPRDRKRRQPSAEYDDNILSSMTYKDLQDEPFDGGDSRPNGHSSKELAAKLPSKLSQYRLLGEREQVQMFAAMSMEDWELSGDWFVDQFTDIMKRLKQARQSKRRMIGRFEDEASAREEAVRLRADTIDRKLVKMRQDGLRVVQDKISS